MRRAIFILFSFSCASIFANEDPKIALQMHEKKIEAGGSVQEIYWSKLQIARLHEQMNASPALIEESYENAFISCPTRAEPLFYLGLYLQRTNQFDKSARVLTAGLHIPAPQNVENLEQWIYDYGMLFEYSLSIYWTGNYKEYLSCCDKLLAIPHLPQIYRDAVTRNRVFAEDKVTK